ncbi:MAG: hypothetical protein RIR18_2046 [Pseudomonadota bacterium]|jgi:hypothetical protein
MDNKYPANKELNRLRDAAGLIPIIESGLARSQLSSDKAALMCEFCEWALVEHDTAGDKVSEKLVHEIREGLGRIRSTLSQLPESENPHPEK